MSKRRPRNYWNYSTCKEETLKFDSLVDFRKNSKSAYQICMENNWIEELCSHMLRRFIWSYEECVEEVSKFKSYSDFRNNSSKCYNAVQRKGWLDTICNDLKRDVNKAGYWTKERCKQEALKYTSKKLLLENSSGCINKMTKEGWLEELCYHMIKNRKPKGYWTKEKCKEEACKYSNKKDFRFNSPIAYTTSVKRKWIEDICSHMEILGTHYKRFIYAYEFPDNHVYVGLTYNFNYRKRNHEKRGAVFNYIQETNLQPLFKEIIFKPVEITEAQRLEDFYLKKYIDEGWVPINKAKTGGLGGGNTKWSFDKIKSTALEYQTKTDFCIKNSWACEVARTNGWFEEVTKHMKSRYKFKGYWTQDTCLKEALKYNSKKEFQNNSSGGYQAARKNKWLDEICSHMIGRKPNGYYTLDKCIELAKECNNLEDYKLKHLSAYTYLYRYNWKDIVTPYFKGI